MPEGTYLEIVGNEVAVVQRHVQRRVKCDDFLDKLASDRPVASGLLPRDCIHFTRYNRGGAENLLFVVEWSPRRCSLNYRPSGERAAELVPAKVYEVWLPWTQWYLHFVSRLATKVYITCTPDRIKSMTSQLYQMPLPNQTENNGFCQGTVVPDRKLAPAQQAEQLISDIVSTIWNDDLEPAWSEFGLVNRNMRREVDDALEEAGGDINEVDDDDALIQLVESKGIPQWALLLEEQGEEAAWKQACTRRLRSRDTFESKIARITGGGDQ